MTIQSTEVVYGPYVGDGAVTDFSFGFKSFSADAMRVVIVNAGGFESESPSVDWEATLNLNQASDPGGFVRLSYPLPDGYKLFVVSNAPETQTTEILNSGFFALPVNNALDKATLQIQQVREKADRALRIPVGDDFPAREFPTAERRALKAMVFDADGNPAVADPSGDPALQLQIDELRARTADFFPDGGFRVWPDGNSKITLPGALARANGDGHISRDDWAEDVLASHIDGSGGPDGMRVQRTAGTSSEKTFHYANNLFHDETRPLRGQTVCFMVSARKAAGYTGGTITCRLFYSRVGPQGLRRFDGRYSSMHAELGGFSIIPALEYPDDLLCGYVVADVPRDAYQIGAAIDVPFLGEAPADDFVDFKFRRLGISSAPFIQVPETLESAQNRVYRRFYSTLGVGFPNPIGAGVISGVVVAPNTNWAISEDVRFPFFMPIPPTAYLSSEHTAEDFELTETYRDPVTGLTTKTSQTAMLWGVNEKGVRVTNNYANPKMGATLEGHAKADTTGF